MASSRDDDIAQLLSTCRVFATLGDGDRLALARSGVRRKLAKEQVIYRRGETARSLVFVLSGRLEIRRQSEDGDELTVRSLGPGALIGLSPALGAAHSADVVAAAESEVLVIPSASLRAVFQKDPEIAVRAVLQLAEWLSDLTDEVDARRTSDVTQRTRRKLRQIAGGQRELRLTHEQLAASVGASRANVSRALKRMERDGEIRLGRNRIELIERKP